MKRYLIETPHSAEECQRLINEIYAMGYLANFDWGCKSGVHCGWAILEADREDQVRLAVPPLVRGKARVIQLNKYRRGTVEPLHPS